MYKYSNYQFEIEKNRSCRKKVGPGYSKLDRVVQVGWQRSIP